MISMKTSILDKKGEKKKEMDLPAQFKENIRPDIIKKAVHSIQSRNRQPYGTDKRAGMKHVTYWSKRRRAYRSLMGTSYPSSRTPRKIMMRRGRQMFGPGGKAPQTPGGRRAHPPKSEKKFEKDINKKERKKAIRSAISASLDSEEVCERHNIGGIELPLIVEDSFQSIEKTQEVKEVFDSLGIQKAVESAKERKVRAGKGKSRGRKYKRKIGPLVVVNEDEGVGKAVRNLSGVDFCLVENLNAELLAPGAQPGRLVVWTESAIQKLEEKDLFR